MNLNKKNPRKQLEKFSTVFMQLGLVLSLFVVFITLEYETENKQAKVVSFSQPVEQTYVFEDTPRIFVKQVEKPKVVVMPEAVPPTNNLSQVDIKENDVDIIESPIEQPKNIDPKIITNIDKQVKEVVIEEEIVEDVPFLSVEEKPVFAGCENLTDKESIKCFQKKMYKLIQRYFDADIVNELDLKSGRNRISTQFTIDKLGNVTDVKIRAPHPKLKKEAEKIFKKVPNFTPGKQNGKPVNVKYLQPIIFNVE